MHRQSLTLLLLPGAVVFSSAVNRSIDDSLGDAITGKRPTFLPSTIGVWEDQTCSGCALQPPISSAFDGTYTAATYNSGLKNISISFDFAGTAIYIFFILANQPAPGITATTAANFTLDGSIAGTFTHSPNPNEPAFQFNNSALVFSKTGLKNASHQMVISTSGISDDIFVNFDYALYTFEEAVLTTSSVPSSSSSRSSASASATSSSSSDASPKSSGSSTHEGAIVGGVVGGLVALGAIVVILFFLCRRGHRQRHQVLGNISDDHEGANGLTVQRDVAPFVLPTSSLQQQQQYLSNSRMENYQNYPSSHPGPSSSAYKTDMASSVVPTMQMPQMSSAGMLSIEPRRRQSQNYFTEASSSDSRTDSPLQYQNRSVISTLPSGHIVMSPGTNRNLAPLHDPPIRPISNHRRFLNISNPSETMSEASSFSLLPPPPPPPSLPMGDSKTELRRVRQRELEHQMRVINEEIEDLRNEAAEHANSDKMTDTNAPLASIGRTTRRTSSRRRRSTKRGGGNGTDEKERVDIGELQDQIRMMTEQIAFLQSQQNSAWAQGLSDEPPPGYSPTTAGPEMAGEQGALVS